MHLAAWMRQISELWPDIRRSVAFDLGTSVVDYAQSLDEVIPSFDHYLNDDVFNKALCKRNLLCGKTRDTVLNRTVILDGGIARAKAFCTPIPGEQGTAMATYADSLTAAELGFKRARHVSSVIAGANVVIELKGVAQEDAAGDVLAKTRNLPKMLVRELEHIANARSIPAAKKQTLAPLQE